jgi:tRNA(fMet)-specific endonuclease VapC
MRYLLDTNTCIGVLTNRAPALVERWKKTRPSQVRLCSVVKAELLYGAEKSTHPDRVKQKLTVFFSGFKSMPFDDQAAGAYGALRASLEREGKPIGPNDMLIAAIALSSGLTVVTHNVAEFCRVPGLLVEDWQALPRLPGLVPGAASSRACASPKQAPPAPSADASQVPGSP